MPPSLQKKKRLRLSSGVHESKDRAAASKQSGEIPERPSLSDKSTSPNLEEVQGDLLSQGWF